MINRIKQLEKIALELEPDLEKRIHLFNKVKQYTEEFLNRIYEIPAYVMTEDKGIGLYDSPISEDPIDIDEALNLLKQHVDRLAKNHQLWFHVDGAYGAFFVLCDEGKKILKGMETSDSIVMDPHKGLFLPYGSGAVLVKDQTIVQTLEILQEKVRVA